MTQKSSEFIGRKDEFQLIEQLFQLKNTLEIVCIHGPGGIGKTRLLHEIQFRYKNISKLFISNIFDFDDPSFHILRNFRSIFAELLDPQSFRPYLIALNDFRKMEIANMSPERLNEEIETIDRIFISCYNNYLAPRQRTVLLFDTIEAIQNEYLWENYLLKQIQSLKNTIVVFAGRSLDEVRTHLEERFGKEQFNFIALKGFTLDEANEYFNWSRVGREIEPELREKIHFLADGKPILIDLAIDWLRWDIPLPDLLENTLPQIKELNSGQLVELREQFEQALVLEILGFTKPTDRAILDMACIHRFFDKEILAYLLGLPPEKADVMLNRLSQFTFVKPRPQGNYILHDEMRRMINNYAWPKYDPFGTQKKKSHAKITQYYQLKTETLQKQIEEKSALLDRLRHEKDSEKEIDLTNELATLEREYWLVKIEHLHHCLRYDLKKALKIFIESVDKATEEFRYEYRRVLFDEILLFEQNYKAHDQYEIYIRQAKYALDKSQYEIAYQDLLKLLQQFADSSEREIDMLVQLGNATVRMGKFTETLNHFQRALQICQTQKIKTWAGIIYNELGWTNRMLGKWDDAIKYYELALENSEQVQDRMSLADTMNNLGYVYSLKGDYNSALAYSRHALEIRNGLGLPRDVGMSHNTLSIIYRFQAEYDISLQHSNQALTIFRTQNDIEWSAKAYRERGVTRWYTNQLEMARHDLEQSLTIFEKYDYRNELPLTYHRLGHVMWDLALSQSDKNTTKVNEYFEKAEQLFVQSYERGMDIADMYSAINSLAGLVELLYDISQVTEHKRISDLRQYYQKLQSIDQQSTFHFPLYIGSAERIMGAVEQDAGNYSQSLAHYKKGYPLIARHGGYSRQILNHKAIVFLGKKIAQLPPDKAIKWCDELIEHWQSEHLHQEFPEFINYCKVWRMRASLNLPKN